MVEKALQEVERASRRILTHAEFGLGPFGPKPAGFGGGIGPKPAGFGGGIGPKPAGFGGGIGPKPAGFGGGIGPKAAGFGGGIGPKPAGFGSNDGDTLDDGFVSLLSGSEQPVEVVLARLFGEVGTVMRQLEGAVADVEGTTANILMNPTFGDGLSDADAGNAAAGSINRSFSELEELSAVARRVVQRVLAHPVYGLGPSSPDLGKAGRQELAAFGGLSRINLRLL